MLKTNLTRCRTAIVTVALAVTGLCAGCAVGVDEPVDPADDSTAVVEPAERSEADRAAMMEQLANDIAADELSDRERALVELLSHLYADEAINVPDELRAAATTYRSDLGHDELEGEELEFPGGPVL